MKTWTVVICPGYGYENKVIDDVLAIVFHWTGNITFVDPITKNLLKVSRGLWYAIQTDPEDIDGARYEDHHVSGRLQYT